jgi:hypothetical protein
MGKHPTRARRLTQNAEVLHVGAATPCVQGDARLCEALADRTQGPLWASTQLAHVAQQDHVLDANSPQRLQPTTPSYSRSTAISPGLRPSLSHHAIKIKV